MYDLVLFERPVRVECFRAFCACECGEGMCLFVLDELVRAMVRFVALITCEYWAAMPTGFLDPPAFCAFCTLLARLLATAFGALLVFGALATAFCTSDGVD